MSEIDTTIALQAKEIIRLRAINAELVEALKEIVEHCDNEGKWNEIVQSRIIERCDDTARAAIAKAEKEGA